MCRHAARFTIGKRSGHMRVGVACVPRQNPQETLTSLSLDGWLWDAFSGALHHGGKIQQHNLRNFVPTTWDTGDTIDLQLDCELGTLAKRHLWHPKFPASDNGTAAKLKVEWLPFSPAGVKNLPINNKRPHILCNQ